MALKKSVFLVFLGQKKGERYRSLCCGWKKMKGGTVFFKFTQKNPPTFLNILQTYKFYKKKQ